ncbi:MAG: hypothetical protein JNM93_03600 [Bacteriovoracaceae bacterium]|nr:hypothetical protein [Bacteriovoracaceae bacterium]
MNEIDFIIGLHSIYHALKNPKRLNKKIITTEDGLAQLQKKYPDTHQLLKSIPVEKLATDKFQSVTDQMFLKAGHKVRRITSGMLLTAEAIDELDVNFLYDYVIDKDNLKILCLDQVTDIQNAAGIYRTAAFYNVDIIILPKRGSFAFNPGFYRISSGAVEHIMTVRCSNFIKMVNKLQELDVHVIGLTEHAEQAIDSQAIRALKGNKCLILGAEETGISHALLRVIKNQLALPTTSQIQSLNVSVAAALALEKSFGS